MGIAVGIDLGTTNSAIARVDEYDRPQIVPNGYGANTTPSVICFADGEPVVGEDAKELQRAGAPQVAAFFKRQMGSEAFTFFTDGREYSATELSALVLSKLKADAERVLRETITDAVITVPAYFRNPAREATIAAGRLAGLNVLQVVNEPTAAAIAYGMRGADGQRHILVYDLGGGTFDVTLMRIDPDEIRILSSEGDPELGGKDWDDRILDFLATRFREELGSDPLEDAESLSDLLVRAEEAKKRLSTINRVSVSIVHAGQRGRYLLLREDLERITADLMERTMSLSRKVLDETGVAADALDGFLLVGGSTRMTMVRDFVTRLVEKPPLGGVNVDEAVALGAALIANGQTGQANSRHEGFVLPARIRTVDVTNHSLGMIAIDKSGTTFINSIILPKNTRIPCTESRPYQHRVSASSKDLEVYVTQGESESPADVTYLGRYLVQGVPKKRGAPTVLDVSYGYDLSGTVTVAAKVRSTGEVLRVEVETLPNDVPDRFLQPPQLTREVDQHTTAYLAFDLSGSMVGEPLREAKRAAKGFLKEMDLAHCSIGIIAFSDNVQVKLRAVSNARKIARAVDELRECETGGGNLDDPFDEVHSLLAEEQGRRFVITLADGVWYDQPRAIERAERCHQAGIESIAIGFGGADPEFLKRIASTDEAGLFTTQSRLVETFCSVAQVLTETAGSRSTTTRLAFFKGRD